MKDSVSCKLSVLLIISLLLSFCSCSSKPVGDIYDSETTETQVVIPGGSFSVAYNSADSLNPFFTSSVANSALTSLLFRSLYLTRQDYTPENDLAQGESLTGMLLTVILKPEMQFSDGSFITSEDVVYSFEKAKNSVLYSQRLKGIASCEQADGESVAFELKYKDINVLNALTFPIVKCGSAEKDISLPVGNGYYKFARDDLRLSLVCNTLYDGKLPEVGTVHLIDTGDAVNPCHLVDNGEIDFCYSDLSDANTKKTYSALTYVYLNNLVYLGVNSNSVNLVLQELRQAVSVAIDRQVISENAFQRYARASLTPFNTAWSGITASKVLRDLSVNADEKKAAAIIGKYGFSEENPLPLTLICPDSNSFMRSAAALLTEQLAKANIKLHTVYSTASNYAKLIESGDYDLYFGELKIPSTMDLSAFFSENGSTSYGIAHDNITCDGLYFDYRSGDADIDTFFNAFLSEMPFIPICFRNGIFCYTRDIVTPVEITEGRIFGDIAQWKLSEDR